MFYFIPFEDCVNLQMRDFTDFEVRRALRVASSFESINKIQLALFFLLFFAFFYISTLF